MAVGRNVQALQLPFPYIDGLTRRQQEQLFQDFQAVASYGGTRWATLVIAASDSTSRNKAGADYVCAGSSDEVKIAAAITTLIGRGTPGRIVLLEGTYSVGAAITASASLSSGAGIEIVGMGMGATKVVASAAGSVFSINTGTGFFALRDMTVSNTTSGGTAVAMSGHGHVIIENCNITADNIAIDINADGAHWVARNNVATTAATANTRAIRMQAELNLGSHIIDNEVTASGTGRGIVNEVGGSFLGNQIIANNTVTGGARGILVNNGAADGTEGLTSITGNRVYNASVAGIDLNGSSYTIISSNYVSACAIGINSENNGIVGNVNSFITSNLVVDSTGAAHISIGGSGGLGNTKMSICFNRCVGTTPTHSIVITSGASNCVLAFNDTFQANSVSDAGTATKRETDFFTISGVFVPAGGTTGQVLAKTSNVDYADAWVTLQQPPVGGAQYQALVKNSSTDYDYSWADILSRVRKNGAGTVGPEKFLNLKEGTSISMVVADNPGTNSVDVTINAVPGAGTGDVTGQFIAGFDGGGSTIAAGHIQDVVAPFSGTLVSWEVLADQSDTVTVEVWKNDYAHYPPTVGDKITASAPPSLAAADHGTSSTLTGWTTAVTAGDVLRFKITTVAAATRVLVVLNYTRP